MSQCLLKFTTRGGLYKGSHHEVHLPLFLTLGGTLLWPLAGLAQRSILFDANFERSLIPAVGTTSVGARGIDTATGSVATLGGSNHSSNYTFLGGIDELRLYPRVLSATEIQSIANATQQVPAAWHRVYFGDAALTGWGEDGDNDGITKLGEYAFGGDPRTPDAILTQPVCSFDSVTGKLSFSFRRRSLAASQNLAYSVETSSDLEEPWSLMASEAKVDPLSQEDCLEWAEYLSDPSVPATSRLFMRVQAELLPTP